MEVLILIVAFWLVLAGVYGAYSLMRSSRKSRARAAQGRTTRPAPVATRARVPSQQVALGGLYSEVDMLRAQVEHLRSEVVALSDTAVRPERPRRRRYQAGTYTELPRMLRRHVREQRSFRHPLQV